MERIKWQWPEGKKCAAVLTFEFDAESVEFGFRGTITSCDDIGGFSPEYGVPRILDLLDQYGIKATFFVPGWDAERYPDSVKEISKRGHEVGAHGYIHEDFSKLDPKAEKEVFEKGHKILTELTGNAPRGFRAAAYNSPVSPNTLKFARDMGYVYDSSFLDDDQPYPILDQETANMIEIPWAWPLNSLVFISPPLSCGLGLLLPPRTHQWVLDYWKEEFDALYEHVGFFCLVVHPRDMGRGSRMPIMQGLLRTINGYEGVWFATCGEVADWCLTQLKR